jgi:hypothetical protein
MDAITSLILNTALMHLFPQDMDMQISFTVVHHTRCDNIEQQERQQFQVELKKRCAKFTYQDV